MMDRRDWLDEVLSHHPEQLRGAVHIDDAGFTDRVMAALPPPRRFARPARSIVLGSATVLAGLLGFVAFPGNGDVLFQAVSELSQLALLRSGASLVSIALITVLVWGAVVTASTDH